MADQVNPQAGWQPQPPQQPGAQPPATAPQPKEPTELEQPVIYYNLKWRVPPLVVTTEEQQDALDPNEWTQDPGHIPVTAGAQKPQYPKLYFNINVKPRVVSDAKEEAGLGSDWQEFSLTESVIKAAWANLQAKQAAQAAKDAAAQQGASGQAGGQPPQQLWQQYPQYGYPQQP